MDNKEIFVSLLKTMTPLNDELNIIYTYYEDEYVYFVRDEKKYVKGIYDYPVDLSTDGYYIEKIKVI